MRLGVVLRYVGIIMLVVALFMLLSAGVSLVSHTDSGYYPLLLSALLTALLGAFPLIFVDRTEQLSSKEGYCIVVGYLMWGGEFSLVNAWFESVSGYTTTGASILKDVEALPRGLLFWRSCSTWLGGVGVVMFALLILPSLGTNKALLTNVELSSMAKHNYHYKASMIAQILLFIYLGLTFCSTLALKLAGMNWFDALTQAMSAVATSGFSTKNASIGYFDSVAVESILIVTMLLASIHFGVLFATLTGRRNNIFHSEVTRWYLSIVAVVTVVVAGSLYFGGVYDTVAGALRYAAFQVVSLISTAGFATADTTVWPATAIVLLISVSIVCGCAGSTTGGIKTDRFLLAIKTLRLRFSLQQHPNAVVRVRIDGNVLDDKIASTAVVFIVAYFLALLAGTVVGTMCGVDMETSFSSAVACMGNVAGIRHGRLAGQLLRPAGRDEVFEYDVDVAGSFGDFRTRAVVFSKMVEMMRKGFFLLAVLVAAGAAEASAQEVTARIAGLEGNAEYMEMLREEASLQAREDSVTMVVNRVRRQLRDDPAQRAVYSAEILRCEEQLFSIRTERGRLTDRINTVEQDWVLANLDLSSPSTTTAGRAAGAPLPDSLQTADLVHNAYFREQLPQADYRALLSAQRRERTAFDLAAACAANYEAIEELKISYDTITAETPAAVLYERYRTLQSLNRSLCDSLQRVWGAVYDNKNYAYAYVLDRLGRDDLLAKTEEQLAGVRQQMASERGRYYADELTDYLLQKRALVDVETELAGALGLTAARDSLARAAAGLRIVDYRLPKLFIEERMFLEYEPIGFVTPAKYNASHHIPEVKVYERGTIYRILLGTYTNRTNGGYLFKGAYPLGYEKVEGKYAYYAGGYRTLDEARAAQEQMKKKGFRRPEIVVWNDGERTNLADAAEQGNAPMFRVEIGGLDGFPEELRAAVQAVAGESEISRAGRHFIVGPLADKAVADKVAEAVMQQNASLEVKIVEIVE